MNFEAPQIVATCQVCGAQTNMLFDTVLNKFKLPILWRYRHRSGVIRHGKEPDVQVVCSITCAEKLEKEEKTDAV